MHPYSCTEQRSRAHIVHIALSVAAVASAYGLSSYLDSITKALWFVEWPSVLGFFALYYMVFDLWVWRLKPVRILLCLPSIEGSYRGTASSAGQQHPDVDVRVRIRQTWTSMSIQLEAPNSRSESESASLCMKSHGLWDLTYTYINKPRKAAATTMNIHQGTTTLTFESGSLKVVGEYYTGRGRMTYGGVELEREQLSGQW